MPGITPRLVLGLFLLPCLTAADFPPAGDFFRQGPHYFDIYSSRSKPSPFDETRPLAARARAYLDIHCSACHQPGGVLKGSLDLRFATPHARTGLFAPSGRRGPEGYLPRLRPGRPGDSEVYRRLGSMGNDAMPPLGRTSVDEPGLALIRAWIESLSDPPESASAPGMRIPQSSARTVFLLPERDGTRSAGSVLPRVAGEPAEPPAIRVCDAGGNCRDYSGGEVRTDAARDAWVSQAPAPLPRGRYWLVLSWNGRIGCRILLVL